MEPKRAIIPGGWIVRGLNSVSQPAQDFSACDFFGGRAIEDKDYKAINSRFFGDLEVKNRHCFQQDRHLQY